MRYDDAEKPGMGGLSFIHDRHPFLGFLHLLHHAERGSSVYMSFPYHTDFYALDQICRYAQEEHGNLQFYISIVGPKHFKILKQLNDSSTTTKLCELRYRNFISNDLVATMEAQVQSNSTQKPLFLQQETW